MNPDELQQVWQSQMAGRQLTINANVLLQQVERNKKSFETMIFWRDFQEVGVSLAMVPLWFWLGGKFELPWTWWLCLPALLWIAGFMIVDRIRQRRRQPKQGKPLRTCVEASLAQVEHQIWLLRNVFWWYLLPPGAAMAAFFGDLAWGVREAGWVGELIVVGIVIVVGLVLWGVYWLNQTTVRDELEPRRRELQSLLASLDGGDAPAQFLPPGGESGQSSSRSRWAAAFQIVLGCAVVATFVFLIYQAAIKDRDAEQAAAESESSGPVEHCPAAGDAVVTNLLVPIRQEHDVPAISAAIVTSKGVTAIGAAGVRKRGAEVPATLDDLWHLGSDTKAMTATLLARLVEQGRLKWDSTVAEVFPELADKFDPDMRGVTLLHLLSHRSGLRPNLALGRYLGDDVKQLRLRAVREELARKPTHKPASHYEYSNLGYIIVGAMVERVTGKTWEEAIRDEVFIPLRMTSAGFGGTGTHGQIDQPWPHHADGKAMPENGPAMDNPPVMGPAGRVHCTIRDWAKFIQDQLRGARGEPGLLKPASYQKLRTPPFGGEYALGWLAVERDWAGGVALNHAGDNTMNFANVWIAPKRDFAILVCVNQSGDAGFKASDEAVSALIPLQASSQEPGEQQP